MSDGPKITIPFDDDPLTEKQKRALARAAVDATSMFRKRIRLYNRPSWMVWTFFIGRNLIWSSLPLAVLTWWYAIVNNSIIRAAWSVLVTFLQALWTFR